MFQWWSSSSETRQGGVAVGKVRDERGKMDIGLLFLSPSKTLPSHALPRREPKRVREQRQYIETLSVGRPRLPHELITVIILYAAEELLCSGSGKGDLLRLASVDRSAHRAIVTVHILPNLRLDGLQQVKSFANQLQRNALDLQVLSKRVKRLTIRRERKQNGLPSHLDTTTQSGAEELTHFERATVKPLRVILLHCTNLEHLALDMPARVLDEREYEKERLGDSLKELVTLLSIYGGDLNEALWSPRKSPCPPPPRWWNLTHLQLHGPRFRMTTRTALAISSLPSLTHLALIMPLLIHTSTPPPELDYVSRTIGQQDNEGKDAIGRYNLLQVIIDRIGHRLHKFLLVCHNVDYYVGSVQKLGPWFRALHWRRSSSSLTTTEPAGDVAQLILVTARPQFEGQIHPEPAVYSQWMMRRAERKVHWHWPQEGAQAEHFDADDGIIYDVESWLIPVGKDSQDSTPMHRASSDAALTRRSSDETARRWLGIDASQDRIESGEESESSVI